MGRQTFAESQIPSASESPVYLDAMQIARGLMARGAEMFIGKVVGAGGAGGSLTGVPFEPCVILASEATGPTLTLLVRGLAGGSADVRVNMIDGAVATVYPSVTKVADNDWTVTCPTALAPNGDTTTLIVIGVPNPGTGL